MAKTTQIMDDFELGIDPDSKTGVYNAEMRNRRKAKHLMQKELGKIISKSSSTIGQIESCYIFPNVVLANKIAKALDTTREILFPEWLRIFAPSRKKVKKKYRKIEIPVSRKKLNLVIKSLEAPPLTPEEVVGNKTMMAKVRKLVAEIPSDRERIVIEERFGLKDGIPKSLEQVGKMLGVNKARIQQIESKALDKLRHPKRSGHLKDFV